MSPFRQNATACRRLMEQAVARSGEGQSCRSNSSYLQRLYQAGREFCESLGSTSVGFLTPKRSERTIREKGFLMRRTIMVLAALSVTLLISSVGTAASPPA